MLYDFKPEKKKILNMSPIQKNILILLGALLYITWVYISVQNANKSSCKAVKIFDKNTINNKLIYSKTSNGGHRIKVEKDTIIYRFVIKNIRPENKVFYDDYMFDRIIKIGESIIKKESFNDSLFVINNDKTYTFKVLRTYDHCK